MNICVLNGSPSGVNSITLQTVLYLEKKFPDDVFEIVHVAARIHGIEKDPTEALNAVSRADLILFCYPVYTFLVPSQLHRFIEIIKAHGLDLNGKTAAQISTSKHFYDTTAHEFIRENCLDMKLSYAGGLSADMDDLLTEKGRKEALTFWEMVKWKAAHGTCEQAGFRISQTRSIYTRNFRNVKKQDGHDTVIVACLKENDVSLQNMIDDFRAAYPYKTRVVNLEAFPFKGGCIGCFNCAATGKCIYKDGFDDFLRTQIQTADATVYAFSIRDHSMGSVMKTFDDRQFCNGHRTVTMGKPVGYLINGDYEREPNLRLTIEGRAQVGGNYLAGCAADAKGIDNLRKNLAYALHHDVQQPAMFLGVGGMKIFRDLIWIMQGLMKADHEFYKEHGFYDFPQKQRGRILAMKLVGAMINNKTIQKKIGGKMTEGMLMPYKKVLEQETDERKE